MPKKLEELKNAKENVEFHGGKKIDFAPVLQRIIASNQFWTKKEVWNGKGLVDKKVSLFRCKKLLDNAWKGGKLARLYQDGKFHYGNPELLKAKQ